jgi:hypothetical protein
MNTTLRSTVERLGAVFSIAAFLVVLLLLFRNFDLGLLRSWTAIATIGAACIMYCASAAVAALAWILIVRSCALEPVRRLPLLRIFLVVQVGKYLPGNFAHFVGQVILAKRQGLSSSLIIFTMFVEMAWFVAIAALLGVASLATIGSQYLGRIPQIPSGWFLGFLVLLTLLAPLAAHRIFERLALWWSDRKGIQVSNFRQPDARTMALVVPLLVINYLLAGWILQLLATNVFARDTGGIFLLSGIFALAWVVGFITPGSPAGLGVREVILISATTPIYGIDTAVGVSALLRLVTVAGDGLAFLVAAVMGRINRFY